MLDINISSDNFGAGKDAITVVEGEDVAQWAGMCESADLPVKRSCYSGFECPLLAVSLYFMICVLILLSAVKYYIKQVIHFL